MGMIEVLALAGAITQISGAISSSIQAGRDVSDLLPHFGKLARLDTEIQLAENGRHKGPLGRLTSSEEEGFAIAQAKMKHKECMDNLRSMCRLYGPPGMWNLVVQEQASARQRHKEQLEAQAKARDQMFWGISLGVGAIVLVGGIFGMYWGLDSLVNG
jgi:hypothetical protein